ncbi:MAG: T9SS type A sorting domain-containing protein [Crocinitomicaceae bacterium]
MGADDFVTQITLNGNPIWTGQNFAFTNLPNNTGLWNLIGIPVTPFLNAAGTPNVLRITLRNQWGAFSALRVCGGVTISSPWPQTTKNASEGDITNDVVTYNNGNVYVTGTFAQQTTLDGGSNPDIIMSTLNNFQSAYIAKYDVCGDLLWESHTQNFNNSEGKAIALDLPNNIVYITGTLMHSNTTTNSSFFNFTNQVCGNPVIPLHNAMWEQGFVASFDMTTGCLRTLDKIVEGQYTDCRAISVDQVTGDVFIAGSHTSGHNHQGSSSTTWYNHLSDGFVNQYAGAGFGLAPHTNYSPPVLSQILRGTRVNDLDYDEARGNLWAVGEVFVSLDYQRSFLTGLETRTSGLQLLEDRTGGTFPYQAQGQALPGGYEGANGVAVDDNSGKIFLTGTFSQGNILGNTSFDIFNLGINIPLNTSINKSAYMVCYDRQNGNHWAESSTDASAWGKAVDVRNGDVCFVGDFSGDINIPSFGQIDHNGNVNSNHLFLTSYDLNGNPLWSNTTERAGNNILNQHTMAVAYDNNNHAFMVGSYSGIMDYENGTSQPLMSTGISGFILRASTTTVASSTSGSIRSASVNTEMSESHTSEPTIIDALLVDGFELSIYPNPNNGRFTIELEAYKDATQVSIFTVQGQKVWEEKMNRTSNNVNLEGLSPGIYLAYFVKGDQRETKKIVIE